MAKIQEVNLTRQERTQLEAMLRKGRWSPREIKRARVLLMADETKNITNPEIAQRVGLTRDTVRQIRARCIQEGVEAAIFDRPRTGQPKKLSERDEAFIIATACSEAPEGYDRWTLAALKQELKRKRGVDISTEPIRKLLLKNRVKPWRKKNVVCAQNNA
ncbi:MAG TPA: helix-turn-helix domain-containing protein [Anaerolineae bacterium]|nr:helix-turn-helix domain-containing protein [Anaerolineae bacterium]